MISNQALVFSALAEPNRLSIIELLSRKGEMSASDISSRFDSSASAVSQHLKVLREARLVIVKKDAQKRLYSINVKTLSELEAWANSRSKAWDGRLSAMDKFLKENKR